MREAEAIISAYEAAQANNLACVLATVVHVEGSSYRRAGARMLVDENGQMTGAISGGCLEGDALKKALHAIYQDKNKLITYDTSDEDDAVIGAQLGCNGVIQVLFEPLHFDDPQNPVVLLQKAINSDQPTVLVSLFDLRKANPQPGTAFFLNSDLQASGPFTNHMLIDQLREDAGLAIGNQVSQFKEYRIGNETVNAFIQLLTPPTQLVLIGAGNDAQVLAQMAELLGWNISVVDGRPSHANAERFAGSCQVMVTKPDYVLDNLKLNDRTAFVLMTHNYQYDLAVLKLLLAQSAIPYIGILGPKKKYERMLADLQAEGIELSEEQLAKVYAPVGLDLGAETPAEIALSILSEIQTVTAGANVTHLRDREGPIHEKKNNEFKIVEL